jgi:hypothetical protein
MEQDLGMVCLSVKYFVDIFSRYKKREKNRHFSGDSDVTLRHPVATGQGPARPCHPADWSCKRRLEAD